VWDAIFRVGGVFGGRRRRRTLTRVVGLKVGFVECHGAIFVIFIKAQLSAAQMATVAGRGGRRRTTSDSVRQWTSWSSLVGDGG
jgi:hypothetical protein